MKIKGPKFQALFFLGITLLALILLSAGLARFELRPGRPFPFEILESSQPGDASFGPVTSWPLWLTSWWGLLAAAAFSGLILLWIITFILRPRARRYLLTRLASYILLALLFYGLFNAFQRSLTVEPEPESGPDTGALLGTPGPAGQPLTPPTFVANPPLWLITAITLILISLILGLAWFLWDRRFHPRETRAQLLAKEAAQAIQAIRAGGDLKDTVLTCYLKMNRLLHEQHGIERQKAMTPREFANHLSQIGLKDEHIRRLTQLFESVRYGANRPSQQEEQEAVACLSAIVEAYGQSS